MKFKIFNFKLSLIITFWSSLNHVKVSIHFKKFKNLLTKNISLRPIENNNKNRYSKDSYSIVGIGGFDGINFGPTNLVQIVPLQPESISCMKDNLLPLKIYSNKAVTLPNGTILTCGGINETETTNMCFSLTSNVSVNSINLTSEM